MMDTLENAWQAACADLMDTPFFRRLREGTLGRAHYRALLREIYYNTRENPPSFALMAWHLKGNRRDIAKRIYRHCLSEHGHHELALADLKALGEDVSGIPEGRPLPTTEALVAFAAYHVQNGSPLAYLGYVYHLEMLPARLGAGFIENLLALGIPREAMTFLTEHSEADQGHVQWMGQYLREAVECTRDLEDVIHGAVGTCRLHGVMLQGVLDSVPEGGDWRSAGRSRPDSGIAGAARNAGAARPPK